MKMETKFKERVTRSNDTGDRGLVEKEKKKGANKKVGLFSMGIGLLLTASLVVSWGINKKSENENKEQNERKEIVENIEKVAMAYKAKNIKKTEEIKEFSSQELGDMGIGLLQVNYESNSLWNTEWRGRLVVKEREDSTEMRLQKVTSEECEWLLPELLREYKEVRVGYTDVKKYSEGLCFISQTYAVKIG